MSLLTGQHFLKFHFQFGRLNLASLQDLLYVKLIRYSGHSGALGSKQGRFNSDFILEKWNVSICKAD